MRRRQGHMAERNTPDETTAADGASIPTRLSSSGPRWRRRSADCIHLNESAAAAERSIFRGNERTPLINPRYLISRVVPQRAYSTTSTSNPKERKNPNLKEEKTGRTRVVPRGAYSTTSTSNPKERKNPNLKEKKTRRTRVVPRGAYSTTSTSNPKERKNPNLKAKKTRRTRVVPRGAYSTTSTSNPKERKNPNLKEKKTRRSRWCHKGRTPRLGGSKPKERKHDDSHLSLRKRKWMISWEGSIASQRLGQELKVGFDFEIGIKII
ncbi:hypothetical protein M5K25_004689 [Dendrobium thyrsiflorum]|uniref:Uncharacterized protein n=1 Tax=Dendrobium thyrsiflorum TaxID=117978 RepID=A0ABD0VMW0_DENTH